ncbi:MAG: hypothetical protein ABI972_22865 [Acidobacteriota bacterium]
MSRLLSVLLTLSMLLTLTPRIVWAQAAGKPKIHILIIEGEGAINNMRQRVAREPIVEVRDENDKPVAGAAVLFALPNTGPSGTFANGLSSFTTTTDNLGRAVGTGLKPNGLEGNVQIKVSATSRGETVSTTINMTNAMGAVAGTGSAAGAAGGSGKLIGILIAVGAAAGVGAAVALRSGGTATPSPGAPRPPVSISIGTGTVGGQP